MNISVINSGTQYGANEEIRSGDDNTIKIKQVAECEIECNTNFDKKQLDKSINKLNNFLKDEKTHAEYSVHDKLNAIMIKIVNDETKEVIMELPPQKILDMVAKMCELVGIGIDKKA